MPSAAHLHPNLLAPPTKLPDDPAVAMLAAGMEATWRVPPGVPSDRHSSM